MKASTRILAILLALGTLTLPACRTAENPPDTTPASGSDTADISAPEETTGDPRLAIPDGLPDVNYDGDDFIIMGAYTFAEANIAPEDATGEVVNDALVDRNRAIDERFDVKIKYTTNGATSHDAAALTVEQAIMSNDSDSFDLIMFHVVASSGNAVKGLYRNWYDIPHVNFDQPWWSDSNKEDLTVNGRAFLAFGDASIQALGDTYCIVYDKDVLKDKDEESLYKVVKDGRWTIDYLMSLSERVYEDANGNGEMDDEDYFGFATDSGSNLLTFFWSCGNKIFRKNSDGEMKFSYYSENLVDTFAKCVDMVKTKGVSADNAIGSGEEMLKFQSGRALCVAAQIGALRTKLGDFEHEYGVVPYPKLNEAQERYYTMADGGAEALAVGKSATELEYIGVITEALCAETYKTVLPKYYDESLKKRYASSPEDAEMIELCVASCVYDWGYVYDNWRGIAFVFGPQVTAGGDITSTYNKAKGAAEKYYMTQVMPVFTAEEKDA